MSTLLTIFSQFILLIVMVIYALQCFLVFRHNNEKDRSLIYTGQAICMITIYFLSFLTLIIEKEDIKYFVFYLISQFIIIGVIFAYKKLYPHANKLLVNNMCMLLSVGFIILSRLSFDKAKKQLIVALISLILTMAIPYILKTFKHLRRFCWILALLGICALLAVVLFSTVINGSKLNLKIAGITFQPSEFVKLIFVFAIAGILAKSESRFRIVASMVIAGAHVLLLVASKDLGSAIIFFIVYIIMLYVSTRNVKLLLAGILGACVSSVLGYFMFSHVRVRVQAWKDPFETIENQGYQIAQSLFAIGTGGFTGMGLGKGAPYKIPVVEADFVFSAISEEFGVLFGFCLILICLSCFVMFMNIAMRFNDKFYKLVAVGLATTYIFQVFLTIGGVTKFIPLTGVTLPLISYGGNSIMVSLIMFSVIQGLYISVREVNNKEEHTNKKHK